MRAYLVMLFIGILAISACKNATDTGTTQDAIKLTVKQEAEVLDSILNKYDVPAQLYKIPSNKPSVVKGKKGTTVYVDPADLENQNGGAISDSITLELQELMNTSDFLRANTQTSSDGRLLVSGGAYYISMTSAEQKLKLKKGRTLKVAFPKITNTKMELFYGQKDSIGNMNWLPGGDKFSFADKANQRRTNRTASYVVSADETEEIFNYADSARLTEREKKELKQQEQLDSKVYDVIELKNLGWINCDYFTVEDNLTDITYEIDDNDSISFARLYLVYKSINSVTGTFYSPKRKIGIRSFNNAPIGYDVRLIAIAFRNNEILTCKLDATVAKEMTLPIVWKKTTSAELSNLLNY